MSEAPVDVVEFTGIEAILDHPSAVHAAALRSLRVLGRPRAHTARLSYALTASLQQSPSNYW